jgi:hypothetical protein
MKRLFLKLTSDKSGYGTFEGARTKNFSLDELVLFLKAWGNRKTNPLSDCSSLQWEWLSLDITEDGKNVYLWEPGSIKYEAKINFISPKEKNDFEEAYKQYFIRRWDDIPKLYMKTENYVEIVEKWQEIVLKQKPNFIILSQDDCGYVDLIGKEELSQQDLADMKIEHEKYLKYKVAYDKYVKSRPDIVDELWHGPQSSEYEADWQKFYEPDDEK